MRLYLTQGSESSPNLGGNGSSHNLGSQRSSHIGPLWTEDRCCDLTSFNGHSLPNALLDNLYRQLGETRRWDKGERGLWLPAEVWENLKKWEEEKEQEQEQEQGVERVV